MQSQYCPIPRLMVKLQQVGPHDFLVVGEVDLKSNGSGNQTS